MNRFAAIAALLMPALYAEENNASQPTWFAQALQEARSEIRAWYLSTGQIARELRFFHSSLPEVGESVQLPESENGDAVIVCDRGLLFDAKDSRMVYVGNVRMRDSRLTLHARDNLYLKLDTLSSNKEKEAAPPTPAETTQVKKPEKQQPVSPKKTGRTEASASSPIQPKKTPDLQNQVLHIETGSAEANVVSNRIILFSPPGGEPIELTRGEDKLIAQPSSKHTAKILADRNGNILVEGADIYISYNQPERGTSTIKVKGGLVYYHAAKRMLTLTGEVELTHPDGKLNCNRLLSLILSQEAGGVPRESTGFMSQFTGISFNGISAATAIGDVRAETKGAERREPGTVIGEKLVYNGHTGACRVTGSNCKLTYGKNTCIFANEGVYLLPNGDIELKGTNLHGTYERRSQRENAAPICGTFKSGGNILFHADTGHITTDKGFSATDPELDFSCTEMAKLTLRKKSGNPSATTNKALPNLAITEFEDIVTASATGKVRLKRLSEGKLVSELQGESGFINMANGSAQLISGATTPAILIHESNRICATPGESPATLILKENGDILLTGKEITAAMRSKDGLTTATGQGRMELIRKENRILTGSGVTIKMPSAIITTRGPLTAILQETAQEEHHSPKRNNAFARHSFNFTGIKSADTKNGGTVRTEKGSMQCTGSIHVTMDPHAGENHEMAGVRHAEANGTVMLLTKDSNNQMIRATGDRLTINGDTGMKSLTGREVILENENNRHIVSGKGAAIHVDKKNKVRITGEKHDTQVTKLNEQSAKHKQNKSPQKNK